MPTIEEHRHMAAVESSLREIARQLWISNRIAGLKIRMENDEGLTREDAFKELDEIMEVDR